MVLEELHDGEIDEFRSFYERLTPEGVGVFNRVAARLHDGQHGLFGLLLARSETETAHRFLALFASFGQEDFDHATAQLKWAGYKRWNAITDLLASETVAAARGEFLKDTSKRCGVISTDAPAGSLGSDLSDAVVERPCSEAMLRFYEKYYVSTPAVTHGITLGAGAAPWQAQLSLFGASTRASHSNAARAKQITQFGRELADWEINHTCGAVYIGGKFLLTAAHCIGGLANSRFFAGRRIRLGSNQIDGLHNLVSIRTVLIHRNYNERTLQNDIALIELDRVPRFARLSGAKLPPRSDYRPSTGQLLLSGWGYRRTTQNASNARGLDGRFQDRAVAKLQGGLLQLYGASVCNNNRHFRAAGVRIRAGQLCAGTATGTDSCRGDSGGPLVDTKTNTLIGIVSGGKGCGLEETPGIYLDVAHYLNWINRAKQAAPRLTAKKKYTFL